MNLSFLNASSIFPQQLALLMSPSVHSIRWRCKDTFDIVKNAFTCINDVLWQKSVMAAELLDCGADLHLRSSYDSE